jgi:hypothetical protein
MFTAKRIGHNWRDSGATIERLGEMESFLTPNRNDSNISKSAQRKPPVLYQQNVKYELKKLFFSLNTGAHPVQSHPSWSSHPQACSLWCLFILPRFIYGIASLLVASAPLFVPDKAALLTYRETNGDLPPIQ